MRDIKTYKTPVLTFALMVMGMLIGNAQFLLQAPTTDSDGVRSNFRWYEAQDPTTVLGTSSFYEATQPGVYFATYDGTQCGSNATGYFILTNCNASDNEVTLDISANISGSATVSWSPALSGDQEQPTVIATETVERYVATIVKAGNSIALPRFTVVCLNQEATLVDDLIAVNEDESIVVPVYANDSDLPDVGNLTTTNPSNGTVTIDTNGTPNNPIDDIVTYIPDLDYNGPDSFDYSVCNASGDCSTATVNIEVLPIVDALDVSVTVIEQNSIDIDVLANDNDLPSIGTFNVTGPSNGTVTVNDNGTPIDPSDDFVTYTSDIGFIGTDSFDYTLCDDQGNCSTAAVTIIVTDDMVSNIDQDNDGIIDSFEDLNLDGDNDPATNPTDSDGDGIADYLDIDSDDDGIPDNVEAQSTAGYVAPTGTDLNTNGVDDTYENNGNIGLIPIDSDNDGLPDYVDDDSDNDGVTDTIEAHDFNQDGIADVAWTGSDKDNDGLDDGYEGDTQIDEDVNDEIDNPFDKLPNTDGDDESDYRDIDDDGDGFETIKEDSNTDGNYVNDDFDEDGRPDYLDPDPIPEQAEEIVVFNVLTPNGDGVHDQLRLGNIENYPNNTVKIYNRWGVQVFMTKSYNTSGNIFDGTSSGRVTIDQDNKLPVGTYFYIIDYEDLNGNMKQLSGYLYINM